MSLRSDNKPVFRPKRQIPFAVMVTVSTELQRLEQEGIMTAVDTDEWAAPIVAVRKANEQI